MTLPRDSAQLTSVADEITVADAATIAASLPLFFQPDDVFEVRALGFPEKTSEQTGRKYSPKYSGFWTIARVGYLAESLAKPNAGAFGAGSASSGVPTGVYFTPQILNSSVLSRSKYGIFRVGKGDELTGDKDVVARRFLVIDVDPVRAKGHEKDSATDSEKAAALEVVNSVRGHLAGHGWMPSIVVDSGNGYHAYYRLNTPEPGGDYDEKTDPITRILRDLGDRFDTSSATIDQCVRNPSRILRMPGTVNRKGSGKGNRPHRWCRVIEHNPDAIITTPSAGELADLLGPIEVGKSSPILGSSSRPKSASVIDRATAYLANTPGAISGNNGHKHTLWVAQCMVRGFNLAPEEAFQLLWKEFNPKCIENWSETELRHKIDEAIKKPLDKPTGWLLAESKYPSISAPSDRPVTKAAAGKREKVFVDDPEHHVNDQVIKAMAVDYGMYQRGGSLVRVILEPASTIENITRPAGPRISNIAKPTLRERITQHCNFVKVSEGEAGVPIETFVHPPSWCVDAVHAREVWPGIRHLVALADYPIVRSDGSILSAGGYDPRTGLYMECSVNVTLPANIESAKKSLLEVVADFPFCEPCHRSAWLASFLSPLARFAYTGATPLFLFDANASGAGKGLLCNTITLMLTGDTIPATPYVHDDDEVRKLITSVAISGERTFQYDNVEGAFGGKSLCTALTTTTWRDRILGKSEQVTLPLYTIWYATGNNVQLRSDMARRVCHIRIESKYDRPEERSGFQHPELRSWVTENRSRLLGDGLTILSEYIKAGRPDMKLKPFGDFIGWSKLVRSAIVWCGLPDPLEGNVELRASSDPKVSAMETLLAGWELLDPEGEGLTSAKIIEIAFSKAGPDYEGIQEAIDELAPKRDAVKFGYSVRGYLQRRFNGRYIDRPKTKSKVSARWFVYGSDGKKIRAKPDGDSYDPSPEEQTPQEAMERKREESKPVVTNSKEVEYDWKHLDNNSSVLGPVEAKTPPVEVEAPPAFGYGEGEL